jgi:hypothetical protein
MVIISPPQLNKSVQSNCSKKKKKYITQRVINKKYENTRPKGRPRKQWNDGILEALGNS